MNIQAMMKQAQKLQKDMMNVKEEIDSKEFVVKMVVVHIKSCYNRGGLKGIRG